MTCYGKTQSAVIPKPVEITGSKVFVASNAKAVRQDVDGETVTMYEFDYTEYDVDEYIKSLEDQTIETQLALCDVYELITGV